MQRIHSTMTADEFKAWMDRHDHTWPSAGEALGVSPRHVGNYRAGHPIPQTIALLCWAYDEMERLQPKLSLEPYTDA